MKAPPAAFAASAIDPRRTAVAAIASAIGVGIMIGRSRTLSRIATVGSALVPALCVGLAAATRRASLPTDGPAGTSIDLSVVVPANDEAAVIADLVGDLARQEPFHGPPAASTRVTVVDDRSRDGTADVVRTAIEDAGRQVPIELRTRSAGRATKGAALAQVEIEPRSDAVVVVLDADARVMPTFLQQLVGFATAGVTIGTARRRMLRPRRGTLDRILATLQDDEQTLDGELQLARWALGGASELRGNGMFVRGDVLAHAGGWNSEALCEDLDLSSRVYLTPDGPRPRWIRELEVWEQPVLGLRALLGQRMRWARGAVRRDIEVTLPALVDRRIPLGRRVDAASYAAQTLAPFVAVGALAGGRRGIALIGRLAVGYVAGVLLLAADSLRWSPDSRGRNIGRIERGIRAIAVTLFATGWVAVVPIAWCTTAARPHDLTFERTRHAAGDLFAPG